MYIYFSQQGDTPTNVARRYLHHKVVDILLKSEVNIDAKVSYVSCSYIIATFCVHLFTLNVYL